MKFLRGIAAFLFGTANQVMATATCIIAAVTTVYAVVSYGQLRAMKDANGSSGHDTYVIERPFFYASRIDLQIAGTPPNIDGLLINPAILNGGNTAPKSVTVYINYYTPVDPVPPEFKFADQDDVDITTSVGGPHDYVRVTGKNYLLAQLQDFDAGRRQLYIYGHIEYDDDFSSSPHHVTQFCYVMRDFKLLQAGSPATVASTQPQASPIANPTNMALAGISVDFPQCKEHNCADESCKRQTSNQ
jgi:hypothetical protein